MSTVKQWGYLRRFWVEQWIQTVQRNMAVGPDKFRNQPIDLLCFAYILSNRLYCSLEEKQHSFKRTLLTLDLLFINLIFFIFVWLWKMCRDGGLASPSFQPPPAVQTCTCFASWPPVWCRQPTRWAPPCPAASQTAGSSSTCRPPRWGSEARAWRRSARSMQINCATPRCMTAAVVSPSTRPTFLRSLMGRGGRIHPGCMSLR